MTERKTWRLKRIVQCHLCPWRVDVDPNDIPNGYSEAKHAALSGTIAAPGDWASLAGGGAIRVMACHEMHDAHCVGWLWHQLGPGNNLALRLHMAACENAEDIRVIGEQHETFADTLPKERR